MKRFSLLGVLLAGCLDRPPLEELPACDVPLIGYLCPAEPGAVTCEGRDGPVIDCMVTVFWTDDVHLPAACVAACP